jgi:hypothetical protein
MFQFKAEFEEYFCGARDIDEACALNPSLQSFDQLYGRRLLAASFYRA